MTIFNYSLHTAESYHSLAEKVNDHSWHNFNGCLMVLDIFYKWPVMSRTLRKNSSYTYLTSVVIDTTSQSILVGDTPSDTSRSYRPSLHCWKTSMQATWGWLPSVAVTLHHLDFLQRSWAVNLWSCCTSTSFHLVAWKHGDHVPLVVLPKHNWSPLPLDGFFKLLGPMDLDCLMHKYESCCYPLYGVEIYTDRWKRAQNGFADYVTQLTFVVAKAVLAEDILAVSRHDGSTDSVSWTALDGWCLTPSNGWCENLRESPTIAG